MYACMYVCVLACMCMRVYMFARGCICMHICMHIVSISSSSSRFCLYVCMYGCLYICLYACMYICLYACMYICLHACMYICRMTQSAVRKVEFLEGQIEFLKSQVITYFNEKKIAIGLTFENFCQVRDCRHLEDQLVGFLKSQLYSHCNTLQHTATYCNTLQHHMCHCL